MTDKFDILWAGEGLPVREGGEVKPPTCRELLDWLAGIETHHEIEQRVDDLAARVEAVLRLHTATENRIPPGRTPSGYPRPYVRCCECQHKWPCPTVQLLEGGVMPDLTPEQSRPAR